MFKWTIIRIDDNHLNSVFSAGEFAAVFFLQLDCSVHHRSRKKRLEQIISTLYKDQNYMIFFLHDWQLFENGNLAIEKNDPPVGDEDVDTVGAVLREHLVLEVLHPEHLFTLRCGIHASQGIDQGAFPNILSE